MLPDDIIHIYEFDGSDNESGYVCLYVERYRDETEEERKKRLKEEAKYKEERKQIRYQTYLKLKKEFENE